MSGKSMVFLVFLVLAASSGSDYDFFSFSLLWPTFSSGFLPSFFRSTSVSLPRFPPPSRTPCLTDFGVCPWVELVGGGRGAGCRNWSLWRPWGGGMFPVLTDFGVCLWVEFSAVRGLLS